MILDDPIALKAYCMNIELSDMFVSWPNSDKSIYVHIISLNINNIYVVFESWKQLTLKDKCLTINCSLNIYRQSWNNLEVINYNEKRVHISWSSASNSFYSFPLNDIPVYSSDHGNSIEPELYFAILQKARVA